MARKRQYRQSARSALDRVEAACGLEAPEASAREVAVAALGCLEEICRDLAALRRQGGWMTLDDAGRPHPVERIGRELKPRRPQRL